MIYTFVLQPATVQYVGMFLHDGTFSHVLVVLSFLYFDMFLSEYFGLFLFWYLFCANAAFGFNGFFPAWMSAASSFSFLEAWAFLISNDLASNNNCFKSISLSRSARLRSLDELHECMIGLLISLLTFTNSQISANFLRRLWKVSMDWLVSCFACLNM